MKFQKSDDNMPVVIYEGYKFPTSYAIFGETNIHELNEDNSFARVYIGSRFEIQNLMKEINDTLQDIEIFEKNEFIVVGLWDSYSEKNDNDYIMLATIISHNIDNPLEYIKVLRTIVQLTEANTSDSNTWTAWNNLCNDYLNHALTEEQTHKIAHVLLSNVSNNMINNFKVHTEDSFLKDLLTITKKLKL